MHPILADESKHGYGNGSERMVRLYKHLSPQYRSRVLASIPSLVGSKVAVIDPVDPLLHMEKVA